MGFWKSSDPPKNRPRRRAPRRVDARDVLDADALTSRTFAGRIVGVFRRTGPDTWDDYVRVDEDGGPIRVYVGTPIQVEREGARFRMRRRGEVVVVEWNEEKETALPSGDDRRARFLETCVRDEDPTPDGNLAAWLHGELTRKPEPKD